MLHRECFETQLDNEDVLDLVEKMLESFGSEGALKITLNFLDIRTLQTPNSPLTELDLGCNDLGDRGVKLLCAGLISSLYNIQILILGQCGLTEGCCSYLASVLKAPNSQLKQLELRDNNLQDSGVTLLCAGLKDPNCKLQELGLSQCGLTEGCCSDLASVLCSTKSQLKQLELRDNDLQDSGVTLLCDGLADPNCKLQKLG
ncbi:hypothetical protein J4Q44_G00043170 [Coregonus suidteri]|uniref:Uncharacterized protein n=1 Tax=Coregonus suidteri TaxID=861788 RepID=A0AAN8M4Z7_9TELE